LRERGFRPADLVDDVADAARAVAMAADGLRPQAERAARFAAAAGIERNVGMLEIADEIILDGQVAFIDRGHERQFVHVFEYRARRIVPDGAARVAIGQAVDGAPFAAFGDLLDSKVELVTGDEIDGRRAFQTALRLDRDFGADEPRLEARVRGLEGLD